MSFHLTGKAPFLSWDAAVIACGGGAWKVEPSMAESAAAALARAKTVAAEDTKAIRETDFPCGGTPFSI